MVELAPEKYKNILGTIWNMNEGMIYIYLTIYYQINKNWFWTIAFAAALQFITVLLIIFFIPESPKWLYNVKQYNRCYGVLKIMAKRNGKSLTLAR